MQQQFIIQESNYSDKSYFRTLSGIINTARLCLVEVFGSDGQSLRFSSLMWKVTSKRNTEI